MKHLGTKVLTTQRFILRPCNIEDAQPMFDNWANDPEVTHFLRWSPHGRVAVSQEVIADWVRCYANDDFYLWMIAFADAPDNPIGSISVVAQDDTYEMVHIGYCIGHAWWRQGVVTEALARLLAFFFNEVGVNRVESQHDPNNPNSGKVMLKCGMQFEGLLRQRDWNNTGICDAVMYGITKQDYTNFK